MQDMKTTLTPADSDLSDRLWSERLNKLAAAQKDVFFVEIGAMDGVSFDPLYAVVRKYAWRGLFVEPLPDLFAKLKENYTGMDGLLFENAAIAKERGEKVMYRVAPHAVQQGLVPPWTGGISSFFLDKNALGGNGVSDDEFKKILPHIITERVAADTLTNILDRNRVRKIDVLQIDTEGYDLHVLRQLDFRKYRPLLIRLEECNLSDTEQAEVVLLLTSHGYQSVSTKMDRIAWREEVEKTTQKC